jgi:hypothetical protein
MPKGPTGEHVADGTATHVNCPERAPGLTRPMSFAGLLLNFPRVDSSSPQGAGNRRAFQRPRAFAPGTSLW